MAEPDANKQAAAGVATTDFTPGPPKPESSTWQEQEQPVEQEPASAISPSQDPPHPKKTSTSTSLPTLHRLTTDPGQHTHHQHWPGAHWPSVPRPPPAAGQVPVPPRRRGTLRTPIQSIPPYPDTPYYHPADLAPVSGGAAIPFERGPAFFIWPGNRGKGLSPQTAMSGPGIAPFRRGDSGGSGKKSGKTGGGVNGATKADEKHDVEAGVTGVLGNGVGFPYAHAYANVARRPTLPQQSEPYHHQQQYTLTSPAETEITREFQHEIRLMEKRRQMELPRRLATALVGGVAVIVPMVIMSLGRSLVKSLVTSSVAVVIFGLGLAWTSTADEASLLVATAGYAAVLAVFVAVGDGKSDA